MSRHRVCVTGFRERYEEERYGYTYYEEERCLLFKYKTVNLAEHADGWFKDRQPLRCYRCPYYNVCFRYEIIWRKYYPKLEEENPKLFWVLVDLNSCDTENTWKD